MEYATVGIGVNTVCGSKTRASFRDWTRKRRTPEEIAMQTNANAQRDLDTLTALNRDYTASV
jgi:hypothetical protein